MSPFHLRFFLITAILTLTACGGGGGGGDEVAAVPTVTLPANPAGRLLPGFPSDIAVDILP